MKWNELPFIQSGEAEKIVKKIVQLRREGHQILPKSDIFRALALTPLDKVRVVILGQDPYHTPDIANGLAFSVNQGIPLPPSLQNIFEELEKDIGCRYPDHGDLSSWAFQGVLLLNTSLTVEAGKPGSHKDIGWAPLIEDIIRHLPGRVWILWGNHARSFKSMIPEPLGIIESAHPSPLSAHKGFFGSEPFSRANKYLKEPINWEIR